VGNHRLEYCSEERDLGFIMRADLKVGSQLGLPLTSSFLLEYSSEYLNEYSSTR